MITALSILWGRAKMNPSSFLEGCYVEKNEDELIRKMQFLPIIEKCPQKDALILHLAQHSNREIRKMAKMFAKDGGLKVPRRKK